MVTLQAVRSSNSKLKDLGPGLVGIFVGGTSGIGETTAREFARSTDQPRIYLVGRNESAATRITSEIQQINSGSKVTFLKSDISLLRNVDSVCDTIKQHEKKVNLLFLSSGILTMQGRNETTEGLDKKFSLHYFSRWRFAQNLTPLLSEASKSGEVARVVSILSAGSEAEVDMDDISLKNTFSLSKCVNHTSTLNSFAAEELAKANTGISFIHAAPGIVDTNLSLGTTSGLITRTAFRALVFATKPFQIPIGESGERHLYVSTSTDYPPHDGPKDNADAVLGSDGVKGSGAYLINSSGVPCGKDKLLNDYRAKGLGTKLWEYTLGVYGDICGK